MNQPTRDDARRATAYMEEQEERRDEFFRCGGYDHLYLANEDAIEFRGEVRPHFTQITNPHEP